eukprot:1159602-Pelagomonas_calceolata.AAC.4
MAAAALGAQRQRRGASVGLPEPSSSHSPRSTKVMRQLRRGSGRALSRRHAGGEGGCEGGRGRHLQRWLLLLLLLELLLHCT